MKGLLKDVGRYLTMVTTKGRNIQISFSASTRPDRNLYEPHYPKYVKVVK